MKYLVIIPARANSKRLPGKNMKLLLGKPLIQYSIDTALSIFDKTNIWINSDDLDIIALAKNSNIQSLIRPGNLSTDFTPTIDVLKHHVNHLINENIVFDAIILLQPTNPFRDKNFVQNSIRIFENSERESLATFSKSEKKLGRIRNNNFEPINYSPGQRSQDLNSNYYENGLLYIIKTNSILKGEIITRDVYPLICNNIEASVDIDTLEDFVFAETLLKIKNYL